MKPKPHEAQNTKFSEYERSSLISEATSELLEFENWTSVIIEFLRFWGHRCPGINEGVFDLAYTRELKKGVKPLMNLAKEIMSPHLG